MGGSKNTAKSAGSNNSGSGGSNKPGGKGKGKESKKEAGNDAGKEGGSAGKLKPATAINSRHILVSSPQFFLVSRDRGAFSSLEERNQTHRVCVTRLERG